ncbi:hypothetical protein D1871_10355 [Nakamurella silvestris]|nr:hypothetical protein D1871_10355 [Nakamurella silvestris]
MHPPLPPETSADNAAPATEPLPATPPRSRGVVGVLRSVVVVLLIITGTLCAAATPPALWTRDLLVDTDNYVRTVDPIAVDPAVQQAVIAAVERRIDDRLDLPSLIERTFPRVSFLGAPLQQAAVDLVRRVTTDLVTSDAFAALWSGINRTAHQQLAALLTDRPVAGGLVRLDQEQLILDLAPVVEAVKARLVAAGLTSAATIPSAGATLDIAHLPHLSAARDITVRLDHWADILPWLALGLLAAAIVLARRRRRALIVVALAVSGAMVLLGLALLLGRGLLLGNLPAQVPEAAAGSLFDVLIRDLQAVIRTTAVAGLVLAAVAVLAGPGPRSTVARVARAGWQPVLRLRRTPPAAYLGRHRTRLWVAVVFGWAFVLVLWDRPTLRVTITLAVVALVLLVLIEILRARPADGRPVVTTPAALDTVGQSRRDG